MEKTFATTLEPFRSCRVNEISFFDYFERMMPNSLNKEHTLHRICTLMRKLRAQSYLEETLELNQELSEEQWMLQQKHGCEVTINAKRITFFRLKENELSIDKKKKKLLEDALLGYAVIVTAHIKKEKPTKVDYMLEAVVRPPSIIEFDLPPLFGPV